MRNLKRIAKLSAALLAAGLLWYALAGGDHPPMAKARRDTLKIGVEVTGRLTARKSGRLGPPVVSGMYQFKIQKIAPEGEIVRTGTPVLVFDGSELQPRLAEAMAARDKSAKELEQREVQRKKEQLDQELQLAEARAKLRKVEMEANIPEQLEAALQLKKARLERDLARHELDVLTRRVAAGRREAAAEIESLRRVAERARMKVQELEQALQSLTVRAPRDGIFVLLEDWQGNKPKVGDTTWAGRLLAEIPDLTSLEGDGEITEALAGKVKTRQRANLTLDALPGVKLEGTVRRIAPNPTRRAWDDPSTVVRLQISLDSVDTEHMRPGMRFRGRIVTRVLKDVVVLPINAIHEGAEGPAVTLKTLFGTREVAVRVGALTEDAAEILGGVEPGQRVVMEESR